MKSKSHKFGEKLDITGERYGALVALYPTNEKKGGSYYWMFKCDCGNEKALPINQVRYGSIKSCGCHINKIPSTRKQRVKVGDKFGKLTVIELLGQKQKGQHFYSKVRCDCGEVFVERDSILIRKRITQCNKCTLRERGQLTHGQTNTRLFNVWQGIWGRCYNVNNEQYHNYGGRGIKMCKEWKNDFMNFHEWAYAHGYDENADIYDCTIERIDVNKDYEPDNCTWIDMLHQARNRQNTIYINYEGERKPIGEVAEITGISWDRIYARIFDLHWDEYDATHIPVKHTYYEAARLRKTVLTDTKTGEKIEFHSASQASLFIGRTSGYFSQKSAKLGNHFMYGKYSVDIEEGERDEKHNADGT